MAEIRYVDWDGLIYYDGKIKDYVDDKIRECLKFRGDVTFEELMQISPSYDNVNTAFRLTEEFTTNDWFKNPGYGYSAFTVVYTTQLEDGTFKYDILMEPTGSGSGVDLSNYYSKDEVDEKIEVLPTKEFVEQTIIEAIDSIEIDVTGLVTKEEFDVVQQQSASNNVKIFQLDEEIIDINQRIDSITTPDLTTYATKEYVDEKLSGIEIPEVDLSNYYDKSETEALVNEAVNGIEIPSTDGLATETFVHEMIAKAELEDKEADLEAYYTKDQVNALIPDVSNFATKDELPTLEGYATEEWVQNQNYLTEHIDISGKADVSELNALGDRVTEVSDAVDGKADAAHTHSLSEIVDYEAPDLSNFVTKEEITDFATEQYVIDRINEIDIPDVSNFIGILGCIYR